MRRAFFVTCLLLITALPLPANAQAGGVVISEIAPDPATGEREFIELWNTGTTTIDLSGWTIRDAANNSYTFGGHSLAADARIVVWGGGSDDGRGPAWSRATAWNNDGDQAILQDGLGSTIDVLAYGSVTWPDGRNQSVPAAPGTGEALALLDGSWLHAQPTPGSETTSQSGAVSATVQDVAPSAGISAPGEVEPGVPVSIDVHIHDDNGDADIASWTLHGDGVLLADGSSAGDHAVTVTPPSDRDTWTLLVEAQDVGGQTGSSEVTLAIQSKSLVVEIPPGGIPFPAFVPGASEVLANATFTLRNEADSALTPRIDVSDLTGPATIPVDQHLSLRYANGTWIDYSGPLTELPRLAQGESTTVQMRLTALPAPLPAGTYGTSFAVVA